MVSKFARVCVLASIGKEVVIAFNTPSVSLRLATEGTLPADVALPDEEAGIPLVQANLFTNQEFTSSQQPCTTPACPRACAECGLQPGLIMPICQDAVHTCSLPCTPCEENAVLRARVNELQDSLHSAQVSSYEDGVARAASSQASIAHTEHLQNRLSDAHADLTQEHADHLEALAAAHVAEIASVTRQLQHEARQAAHDAYLVGLEEGSPDPITVQRLSDMAVDAAVANAGRTAAQAEQTVRNLQAYQAGEIIGSILANSSAAEEINVSNAPVFDAAAAGAAVAR